MVSAIMSSYWLVSSDLKEPRHNEVLKVIEVPDVQQVGTEAE